MPSTDPGPAPAAPTDRYLTPSTPLRPPARLVQAVGLLGLAALVGLWWVDSTITSWTDVLYAVARLAGLGAGWAMLCLVVLASRIPLLEEGVGTGRVLTWHSRLGRWAVWATVVHLVFVWFAYGATAHTDPLTTAWQLATGSLTLALATISAALLLAVGILSARLVRARVPYEVWQGLHLLTYAVIVLAVFHQIVDGEQFASHPVAAWTWGVCWVAAVAALVVFRLARPLILFARHRFEVAEVTPEGPGVVSVYLTGRHLERLHTAPGQFFRFRFLTPGMWWAANPYSLSAAPRTTFLRITVKEYGAQSAALRRLTPGTPVILEGPSGADTPAASAGRAAVLIAGGIGIAPMRALFEAFMPLGANLTLIYRAHDETDLALRSELEQLARTSGAHLYYLLGPRADPRTRITAASLSAAAPGLAGSDVYLCGPADLVEDWRATAREAGARPGRIHAEEFTW